MGEKTTDNEVELKKVKRPFLGRIATRRSELGVPDSALRALCGYHLHLKPRVFAAARPRGDARRLVWRCLDDSSSVVTWIREAD